MTDSVIIAVVLGVLGIAAVSHGGLDGFGPIAGTFAVALLVRHVVGWSSRRVRFPRAKANFTSRSEDPARPPDSAAD